MLLHKSNRLKNKVDKCHVTVSTKKLVGITIGGYTVDNSQCEKLLCVEIDINLSFNYHISGLCRKAIANISTLARLTPLWDEAK